MKMSKNVVSLLLCLSLIFCALSLSSFASLFPFALLSTPSSGDDTSAPSEAPEETTAGKDPGSSAAIGCAAEEDASSDAVPEPTAKDAAVPEQTPADEPNAVQTEERSPAAETVAVPDEPTAALTPSRTQSPAAYAEPTAASAVRASDKASDAEGSGIAVNTDVKDHLSGADSENAYLFSVDRRGVLYYTLKHDTNSSAASWRVTLYQQYNTNGYDGDTAWRLLNVLDTRSDKTTDRSPNIGLQKGVYRLVVSSGDIFTPADYTLNAAYTEGSGYEIEYNDTVYRYTEIYPDVPLKGSSLALPTGTDTDWYMFRVYDRGKINLRFEHTRVDAASVYWKTALFDSSGRELYSDNVPSAEASVDSGEIGLAPGCYFIRVEGRVYTDFDYTLTLKRSIAADHEIEPNDTAAEAVALPVNGSIKGALTSASGAADSDLFAFTPETAGYARFTFTIPSGTDEDVCHRVKLTDQNGVGLWEARVSPAAPTVCSPCVGLDSAVYYIRVDNNGLHDNNATYTLTDKFFATSDWEREYNGSMRDADAITRDVGISGTITDCEAEYDDDYFCFTLSSPAMISVDLTHDVLSGDKSIFAFTLLDDKGTPVQTEDRDRVKQFNDRGDPVTTVNSLAGTGSVYAYYTLPSGTYYIRVTSGLFTPDIRYLLTYSVKTGG